MKKFKLLLMSLVIGCVSFMYSCGNSSQNSVVASSNVNADTIDTRAKEETKIEIVDTQKEKISEIENTNNINVSNEVNDMNTNDILVVYFSATGTTKKVAEKIAELTGGDLYEIVPKNPYSAADLNWNDRNSRTTKEMDDVSVRPEIASNDLNLASYKTIYMGYPIWWGDAPRIMSTFVEKYNFDGKKAIPFCTSGGSGIGRSGSNLGTLAGGGNFVTGERLNSSADTNNIQNFINNNQ